MNATVATSIGLEIDPALRQEVVALSRDHAPQKYPAPDSSETVEVMQRRSSERNFQEALCRRVWWRLSGEQRAALRQVVFAKESWFTARTDSSLADTLCLREIGRILEQAQHET